MSLYKIVLTATNAHFKFHMQFSHINGHVYRDLFLSLLLSGFFIILQRTKRTKRLNKMDGCCNGANMSGTMFGCLAEWKDEVWWQKL